MTMNLRIVEPVSLASLGFYALREAGSRLRHSYARSKAARHARSLRIVTRNEAVLNYGWMEESSSSSLPIGGEIKLIPLKASYPEHLNDFNLIYLVSSALPPHAEEIVRLAKKQGALLVWNQNGVAYPGCYGDFYPWFNLRMAALRSQADFIVNQSEFSRISADRYLGDSVMPSEICFNPVDTMLFSPRGNQPDREPLQILAAGTSLAFYRTKSAIDTLRVLLERGRKVHLTIAGQFRWPGGDAQVAAALRGIEEYVTILPPFRQDDAPEIYQRAHLLLHTKFNDPCPTVPIEAMSCGLPVVGTHSGGMSELVPKECGVLVPVKNGWERDVPGDPVDLADAVECVMGDHAAMATASRRHALQSFDLRNWLGRHDEIFRRLLDSR